MPQDFEKIQRLIEVARLKQEELHRERDQAFEVDMRRIDEALTMPQPQQDLVINGIRAYWEWRGVKFDVKLQGGE